MSDLLFFSRGRTFKEKPTRLPSGYTANLYRALKKIDPLILRFGPRQWRANKSDWLIRNQDLSTAASLLQNTESTLLKHYTAGSESRAIEEMGGFFEQLSLLRKGDVEPLEGLDSGVGGCCNYGHAKPAEVNPPIQPNCQQPEGCLFCEHYFLHADETDTRKLISFRYCIGQMSHLSASSDHFELTFHPVLTRIEEILNLIRGLGEREDKMIDSIITEVETEERLSPYWADKLQMLMELGATKLMKNNIAYEPMVDALYSAIAPDTFSGSSAPPHDFVVSRTHDGKIASLYSDNIWNWSAYEHRKNSALLVFDSWIEGEPTQQQRSIVKQLKWIMFTLIWFRKSPLGAESLKQRLLILRKIASYTNSNDLTIQDFFGNAQILAVFVKDKSATRVSLLPPLLKDLIQIGKQHIGFRILGGVTIETALKFKVQIFG